MYRALWFDDADDVSARLQGAVEAWLRAKFDLVLPAPGSELVEAIGPKRVRVSVNSDNLEGLGDSIELVVAEETLSPVPETWTTTVRGMNGTSTSGQVWIDVNRVSDDPYANYEMAAPRFVSPLIDESRQAGGAPRWGSLELRSQATAVRPDEVAALLALLEDRDRQLPVVLFRHHPDREVALTIDDAQAAAARLAGVALVRVLPPQAAEEFSRLVPPAYDVHPGAARAYLHAHLPPHRHRYVPKDTVQRFRQAAAKNLAAILESSTTARRPSDELQQVRRSLLSGGREGDQLAEYALEENERLERELTSERVRREQLELELELLRDDVESREEELRSVRASFRQVVGQNGGSDEQEVDLNPEVVSVQHAIDLARERLTGLAIPDGADRDIAKLDTAREAQSWARTTWDALRALDDFARSEDRVGSFWDWCERSGSPNAWPATPKKLAMRESETTMNSERYRRARQFPVAASIDPACRMEMQAHLKIAEGGGPLAPRVYFHDGTRADGRVHVGFIGPHDLVPNASES